MIKELVLRLKIILIVLLLELKWIATFVLIAGSFINSLGMYPLGPIVTVVGSFAWLVASIRMKDNALVTTNAVMIIFSIIGLVINYTTNT